MDKKVVEKKTKKCNYVAIGFWAMISLFILMMVFSFLNFQWPSLISGILFIVSVFFVFVTSIQKIVPENSMAYIALGIAIIFILYLLLSATLSVGSSMLG